MSMGRQWKGWAVKNKAGKLVTKVFKTKVEALEAFTGQKFGSAAGIPWMKLRKQGHRLVLRSRPVKQSTMSI